MTLWSGRFDTAPDPAAFDFGISFGFDRALFEDDITGSLAWAEALGAAGVLSAVDVRSIVEGLNEATSFSIYACRLPESARNCRKRLIGMFVIVKSRVNSTP